MVEVTARHGLALLVAGQGQKDVTHNEALVLVDALLGAVVEQRDLSAPPAIPGAGSVWLVAEGASGDWFGKAGELAIWTAGGWRFAPIPDGMALYIRAEGVTVRKVGGTWRVEAPRGAPAAPVGLPAGGPVVDFEARTAIGALVSRLEQLGLLGT
jgi:hypothetical protein